MTATAKLLTEDQIIISVTQRWFQESPWNIEQFAAERLIPALEAHDLVSVQDYPDTADGHFARLKARGVHIGKILRGTSHFPLAWKWVWISCLPAAYQAECRKQLLALAGVLDVPVPPVNTSMGDSNTRTQPAVAHLHVLLREFSELVAAAAPAHDGQFDTNDQPDVVDRYINELIDMKEAIARELMAIHQGTGRLGQRSRLHLTLVQALLRVSPDA